MNRFQFSVIGCLGRFVVLGLLALTPGPAQVRVTCIAEPNERLKDVEQLGCDFKNLASQPVVLSAGDVRDGSLDRIGSPLRYSVAQQMIDRSERRGFWGTLFQIAKWVGVAASFAQGLDFIQLSEGDNWAYLIPTLTGGMQAIDAVGRAQHTPLTMPADYLPEGDFVLDAHETRSYVLLAATKQLASFRMTLNGRALAATEGARFQRPGVRGEPLDRDAMNREALERINGWVDRFYVIDDAAFPQPQNGTGGSSWYAVPQVEPSSWTRHRADSTAGNEGNIQAEPAKGVEVPTVAGAASAPWTGSLEAPLPLSERERTYLGLDAAAVAEWIRIGEVTAHNMGRF